jgi:hypothetical protein
MKKKKKQSIEQKQNRKHLLAAQTLISPCTLPKIVSHSWNHLVQRQRRRGPIRDAIPADHRRHAPRRRHQRWKPAPSAS